MGICQVMPSVYDCYVYNDFTKDTGRNNDNYTPEYIDKYDDKGRCSKTRRMRHIKFQRGAGMQVLDMILGHLKN